MFDWSSPYPAWIYLVLGAGCLALILLARHWAISLPLRRWTLFIPRLLVLGMLLWILRNPVLRQEHRLPAQPAQILYLLDSSRSMGLEEPASRASRVRQLIEETDRLLTTANPRPRLSMFRFGAGLAPLPDFSQFRPTDDASELATALEQLPARFSREAPRGVVVFSDGALDDEGQLPRAAQQLAQLQVPVHVFPVGDRRIRGDVGIEDLVIPPRVDAGAKATLRGIVRGTGYTGERVVVAIRSADRPEAPPLASLPLTLTDQPQPFELLVDATPDNNNLLLEVPPLPGEATERNNRVRFQLGSTRRKLRVLYMEGTPGNEYHWVHDARREDKDIECVSLVADNQYVQRPRLVRVNDQQRGFPTTREELLQFDCVICSDISLGAFTRENLDWVVELVAERGGGFVMVGGNTSFGAGGWDRTVWDQLIPVDMQGGPLGRGTTWTPFHVRVPANATTHPIWRIVDDPVENERILKGIPVFYGTNYIERLKPAATVLATTVEPIPNIGREMPIFAAQPYGKGRTFAFSPDTTADWGRDFERLWGEGDNRYFRRFWRNLVRWLCENSQAGSRRVLAGTDRVLHRAGQPIELTARTLDEQAQETTAYEVSAELQGPGPGAGRRPLWQVPLGLNASGKGFAATLDSRELAGLLDGASAGSETLAAGTLDVVASQQGREVGRTSVSLQILPDLHELLRPQPRPESLSPLAEQTGGQVLTTPTQLADLLRQLPATDGESLVSRQPLWDRPWVLATLLGLLAVEWSLRRLAGFG